MTASRRSTAGRSSQWKGRWSSSVRPTRSRSGTGWCRRTRSICDAVCSAAMGTPRGHGGTGFDRIRWTHQDLHVVGRHGPVARQHAHRAGTGSAQCAGSHQCRAAVGTRSGGFHSRPPSDGRRHRDRWRWPCSSTASCVRRSPLRGCRSVSGIRPFPSSSETSTAGTGLRRRHRASSGLRSRALRRGSSPRLIGWAGRPKQITRCIMEFGWTS